MNAKSGWKDGILSAVMRDMSKENNGWKQSNKWLVCDGTVDPEWVENINTVMDDNRVMTLISNERIPFTNSMRIIFEAGTLTMATPSTISRGGMLWVSPKDIGMRAYFKGWLQALTHSFEVVEKVAKVQFELCFESGWFETTVMKDLKDKLNTMIPVNEIAVAHTITALLDALLKEQSQNFNLLWIEPDDVKLYIMAWFSWAVIQTFGGFIADDKDHKSLKALETCMRNVCKPKLPDSGSVMDYKFSLESNLWVK